MSPGSRDKESHWKAYKSQGGAQESQCKSIVFFIRSCDGWFHMRMISCVSVSVAILALAAEVLHMVNEAIEIVLSEKHKNM